MIHLPFWRSLLPLFGLLVFASQCDPVQHEEEINFPRSYLSHEEILSSCRTLKDDKEVEKINYLLADSKWKSSKGFGLQGYAEFERNPFKKGLIANLRLQIKRRLNPKIEKELQDKQHLVKKLAKKNYLVDDNGRFFISDESKKNPNYILELKISKSSLDKLIVHFDRVSLELERIF